MPYARVETKIHAHYEMLYDSYKFEALCVIEILLAFIHYVGYSITETRYKVVNLYIEKLQFFLIILNE